ncbi:hypothetical protein [Campylobacter concisus]|uniref:hypothetical protein n=1 Tax=Campylobacter concisus TaxID=199 RepID=UPI00122CF53A|nr:hypothetical protein [Campylobacter concisus]
MFNRIGGFFIGFMCLLYCISMLANKNVKVGEKFFKFDDTGYLYLLPAFGFLVLSIYGFWMAFRKEPPIVQRLVGMWCPDCMKFYNIGETTCEKCGQGLLKCYNTHYETRPKPKTGPLFRSKPRNKKRKLKR